MPPPPESSPRIVEMFTDGACESNPGRGGWATLLRWDKREKMLSGGFARTTNNRMELTAVIEGLKALQRPGLKVRVVSDSKYVTEPVTQRWLEKWAAKQFRKAGGLRDNADLWIELRRLLALHDVTFEWIKGHAGHPENENCDELAVLARAQPNLPRDEGYEAPANAAVTNGLSLL
ncbi:ribonuclease HI [Synoicihabitans lomoniglobus]|uniref:Ribonuclease H n=1 Tax=Synoicihabitans lomoniglobus TaxID=2909285 RepID=A0AAE9ZX68_9BACT|nr:ribonuclease HI [Opitutaceae bacterium LMO-M01]WED65126.1 ribonuclease HI [Opitutaceae bacterium LMO-M01]